MNIWERDHLKHGQECSDWADNRSLSIGRWMFLRAKAGQQVPAAWPTIERRETDSRCENPGMTGLRWSMGWGEAWKRMQTGVSLAANLSKRVAVLVGLGRSLPTDE